MTLQTVLPARRQDLVQRELPGEAGCVIKDPHTGRYFQLASEEAFLFRQLDGERSLQQVCDSFEKRFESRLSFDDLDDFLQLANTQGLLESASSGRASEPSHERADDGSSGETDAAERQPLPRPRQNILYWRMSLVDPDRCLTWLAPRLSFVWTPFFLSLSFLLLVSATVVFWLSSHQLSSQFSTVLHPQTTLLVWGALVLITLLHEMAHGLTCKRYGGEVHEMGFLMMFFIPCVYCNVSDAWLLPRKTQRLSVTAAGVVSDLIIWAIAVLTWRLTLQSSLLNFVAWITLTVTSVRIFFNLNPLLKLDGYYLLGDLLDEPNLRQRSVSYFQTWFRSICWGGPRPDAEARPRLMLAYGAICWLFSLLVVGVILWGLGTSLSVFVGSLGLFVSVVLAAKVAPSLLGGLAAGEPSRMVAERRGHTLVLGGVLASIGAGLFLPIRDQAKGNFELVAHDRAELRASVAGFARSIDVAEGESIRDGQCVAKLTVPGLDQQVAQRIAALSEAEAEIALLKAGPRVELLEAQRQRVKMAQLWRNVAQETLHQSQSVLRHELAQMDSRLEQETAEADYAKTRLALLRKIDEQGNVGRTELLNAEKNYTVSRARCDLIRAERRAREAKGILAAQAELAEREKMLVDEQAELRVLSAGPRPEELRAAVSKVARLREELNELKQRVAKLTLTSPIAGIVATPRPADQLGQYFSEGDLIIAVENARQLEVRIEVEEQEATDIQPGQLIRLKPRSQPFEVFECVVENVSPRAETGDLQSTFTVYGQLANPTDLKPGMSGLALVDCGRKSLGTWLLTRLRRALRTEMW